MKVRIKFEIKSYYIDKLDKCTKRLDHTPK